MSTAALSRPAHYSAFTRAIHWLTALLMVAMFYTGFTGFGKPKPGEGGRPPGGADAPAMAAPGAAPPPASVPETAPQTAPEARNHDHDHADEGAGPSATNGALPAAEGSQQPAGGPQGARPPQSPFAKTSLHKAIGFTILLLAAARILYRLAARARFPELPNTMPAWQIWAARGVQGLLYAGLVVQPLSGWLGGGRAFSYFGLFTLPAVTFLDKPVMSAFKYIHTHFDWILLALIAAHTVGALYHHYVLKDNTLRSMIRGA